MENKEKPCIDKVLWDRAFEFYDQHGLPLEIQHDMLKEKNPNFRIDLYKFSIDAAKAGWKTEKIKSTISTYCSDVAINLVWEK